MKRFSIYAAALLAVCSIVYAADSVVPSRLRVQSLGVGVVAPTGNGDVRVNRSLGVGIAAPAASGQILATDNVSVMGNVNNFVNAFASQNASTGNAAITRIYLYNDAPNFAQWQLAGSGHAGLLGMPAGASVAFGVDGTANMCLYTNNVCRMQFNSSGGTIASPYVYDIVAGATPSITSNSASAGALSPTMTDNGVGNWALNHNIGSAVYNIQVTQRSQTVACRFSVFALAANSVTIRAWDTAGAASDSCVAAQVLITRYFP